MTQAETVVFFTPSSALCRRCGTVGLVPGLAFRRQCAGGPGFDDLRYKSRRQAGRLRSRHDVRRSGGGRSVNEHLHSPAGGVAALT